MHLKLRWRSILASSAVIALLVSTALIAPMLVSEFQQAKERRTTQPHPASATDTQQREIVRAVIQEYTYDGTPLPPPNPGEAPGVLKPRSIILLSTSTTFCGDDAAPSDGDWSCASPPLDESIAAVDFDAQIPRKLRQELVLANRKSTSIPDPGMAKVIYRPRAIIKQIFSEADGWSGFYALFPHSGGFVETSRAVLSHNGTHALIYVAHRCGGLCGTGTLHYLVRAGNTWRVATSIRLWVS